MGGNNSAIVAKEGIFTFWKTGESANFVKKG